jgi:hypothetical protein
VLNGRIEATGNQIAYETSSLTQNGGQKEIEILYFYERDNRPTDTV